MLTTLYEILPAWRVHFLVGKHCMTHRKNVDGWRHAGLQIPRFQSSNIHVPSDVNGCPTDCVQDYCCNYGKSGSATIYVLQLERYIYMNVQPSVHSVPSLSFISFPFLPSSIFRFRRPFLPPSVPPCFPSSPPLSHYTSSILSLLD